MKLAILFAGQGSQHPGMGKDLYEAYPEFREVFDLLPEEQKQIAFEGPEDALKETRNTQPVMLAFAVGVYNVLKNRGIKPEMAAGLSLGEYSALTAAGVFDEKTAIDLITLRADAMAKASEGVDTVMSAVIGLGREALADACEKASAEGPVEIANYNCPGQIVISGSEQGVAACEALAKEAGARRCLRLAVSGPFHTSYMIPAGETLRKRFDEMGEEAFAEPAFPVIFNCTGRPKEEGASISDLLVKQVSGSVYFEDTIKYMESCGIDTIIEIGPGRALSGFVKKTTRGIRTVPIETKEELEQALSDLA